MARVIDVHAHAFPRTALAAGLAGREWHGQRVEISDTGRITLTGGSGPDVRMDSSTFYREPVESRLAVMDRWGVDVQVLSISPVLLGYGRDPAVAADVCSDVNDDLAATVAEHPGRFAGLGMLPLQDAAAGIRELERCVDRLGLVGACVGTHVNGTNWDDDSLRGVLEAAESLGALLFVHPADVRITHAVNRFHLRNTIGNPLETTIAVASIVFGGVLERFEDLKLCFAHGGGYACWGAARLDHGHRVRAEARALTDTLPSDHLRRLHFDSLTHSLPNLDHLVAAVGASQVVLGTDFPADMGQVDPVAWLTADGTRDDETTRAILGANAERLIRTRAMSHPHPTETSHS